MTRPIGITITERGAAIVTVERNPADVVISTAIERLPFDLGAVTDRVRALDAAPGTQDDPEVRYVIDAERLGRALYPLRTTSDGPCTRGAAERQALVDELLVAIEQDRFRFAAGPGEQDAISKALTSYRRMT